MQGELHPSTSRLGYLVRNDKGQQAHLPKPMVGISQINVPNAFAYGRTQKDGRICVTQGILKVLNRDELKTMRA
jgi:heat shock protein HtpX